MAWEKAMEIARQVFPDYRDDFLGWLIWNATGYPHFWKGEPEECLREQLEAYGKEEKVNE